MEPTAAQPLETRVLAEGLDFPEGPIALADGSVLVVEIRGGRLSRVATDGSVTTVAELGGGPNGAAVGPDGAVYVANCGGFLFLEEDGIAISTGMPSDGYTSGLIQRVDLTTGSFETLYDSCDGQPLVGPNDLVFDAHGGFYFTDNGKIFDDRYAMGGLFYALADGSSIRRLAAWQPWPNGIGLSPDGRTLYVALTVLGWLTSWQVTAPGEIAASSHGIISGDLVGKAMGRQSFDSLAVEADGTVCVATLGPPGGGAGGITVFPPGTTPTLLAVDDPSTTNLCFGGDDLRTAYITSSGRGQLLIADWPRSGLPLSHGA